MFVSAFDSAKRRIKQILVLAGVALTVAGSALPAQASASHRPAGAGTGHRIG
jgi:hypothetical protein